MGNEFDLLDSLLETKERIEKYMKLGHNFQEGVLLALAEEKAKGL